MIKKLLTAVHANDNMLYFVKVSRDSILSCNEMGILSIGLNIINLDDINYDADDLEIIIHVKLLTWNFKFEERKTRRKE